MQSHKPLDFSISKITDAFYIQHKHVIDGLFESAKNNQQNKTATNDIKRSYDLQTHRMIESCCFLTERKIFVPTLNELGQISKQIQLLRPHKVIALFQKHIDDCIEDLAEFAIKLLFKDDWRNRIFEDPVEDALCNLINSWSKAFQIYRANLDGLSPVLTFVQNNYPRVWSKYNKKIPALHKYENLLVEKLELELGEHFKLFLDIYIDRLLCALDQNQTEINEANPLRVFHREDRDITILKQSARDFFIDRLTLHVRLNYYDSTRLTNYLYELLKFAPTVASISVVISPNLVEEMNERLLELTLGNPKIVEGALSNAIIRVNLFDVLRESLVIQDWEHICLYFESRRQYDEFGILLRNVIHGVFQDSKNVKGPALFFENYMKLMHLMSFPKIKKYSYILQKEKTKTIGSNINEQFLKNCEKKIRLSAQKSIIKRSYSKEEILTEFQKFAPEIFLYLAQLEHQEFTVLYKQSFFRRYIMSDIKKSSNIMDEFHMDYYIRTLLEPKSREIDGSAYRELEIMIENFENNLTLYEKINTESTENMFEICPLILDRNCVPNTFLSRPKMSYSLPLSFQNGWKALENQYRTQTGKGEMKKLEPIYELQSCEVSTPYTLQDGNLLILQLTLFQTCVLDLFNQRDSWDYDGISKELNLETEILNSVLLSFTNADLLKRTGTRYMLNPRFRPNPKYIKDNKLRINFMKSGKPNAVKRGRELSETVVNAVHTEGPGSMWSQELLKACITRVLKAHASQLDYKMLYSLVRQQVLGISFGEFDQALKKCLDDNAIQPGEESGTYIY